MGFKPETMTNKILPALGYNGPKDQKSINAFLAANPAAAAKMGKYTMAARQMVEGKPIQAANGKYTNKGKPRTGFDGGTSREDMGIGRPKAKPQSTGNRFAGLTPRQHQQAVRDFSRSIGTQGGGGGSSNFSTGPLTKTIRAATNTTAPSTSPTPTINPDPAFTPATRNPANMMPSRSLLSQQIGL